MQLLLRFQHAAAVVAKIADFAGTDTGKKVWMYGKLLRARPCPFPRNRLPIPQSFPVGGVGMSSPRKSKHEIKVPQASGNEKPKGSDITEEELRAATIDFNFDAKSADRESSVHLDEPPAPTSGTSLVSWAEVLRQRNPKKPSDDEVVIGSLAELQIDAVSDNDILKHLAAEGLQAATNKSGILRYNKPSNNNTPAADKDKGAAPAEADDDLVVPKRAEAPAPNVHDDERWHKRLPKPDGPQSSSVDLNDAARAANQAGKDDDSSRTDNDALADALYPDDGSSRVNLGIEPRIAGLLSDDSLQKAPRAAPAPVRPKPPSKPQVHLGNAKQSWIGGAAVGFTIALCLAIAVWSTGWLTPSKRSAAGTPVQTAVVPAPAGNETSKPDDATREQLASLMASQHRLDEALQTVSTKLHADSLDELAPALDNLVAARQKAEDDHRQAVKSLRQAQANLNQANQDMEALRKANLEEVKATQVRLDTAVASEKEARQAVTELLAARKTAEESFGSVTEKLRAAKLLGENADRQAVLKTIDELLRPKEDGNVKVEIAQLRKSLEGARSPGQMLELWPALLGNDAPPQLVTAALADADSVASSPAAQEETRAKALAVKALAQLAREDFTAARTTLNQLAGSAALNGDAAWPARLKRVNDELRDSSQLREQIRRSLDRGDANEALALSERGLKVFPKNAFRKDHHRVLALRAESLFQLNRLDDAEKDATVALETGLVFDGQYTLGRVAERRKEWAKAKEHFGQAFTAAKQTEAVKQSRLSLARVLASPDATDADLVQAAQLADQAIAAGQPEGYLVKARVLHRQKKFGEAVETSLLALQHLTPEEYGSNWTALAREYAESKGDWAVANSKPNRAAADPLFSTGMRHYFAHQFAEAETKLAEAVKNNPKDARYYYFLALSRLPQGKVEAAQDDLNHAVALERQGLPDRDTINGSLERIQGAERQWINRFRR
jgi:tetratricopeptide (TPR) repeat protein